MKGLAWWANPSPMVVVRTSSRDMVGDKCHMSTNAYRIAAIEINLREPAMLSGKKGFERIRRAFKEVLNEPVTWLFYDHEHVPEATQGKGIQLLS